MLEEFIMSERNQWDSSIAFIFAMIGAAVGLGNIWRFSYVLYSNGGGSFFIPYFIAIAIMGIPYSLPVDNFKFFRGVNKLLLLCPASTRYLFAIFTFFHSISFCNH